MLAGRFASVAAVNVAYIVAAEIFPTLCRNSGIGWGSGCGRLGAILAPLIMNSAGAPLLLFAALCLVAAASVWASPESRGRRTALEDVARTGVAPLNRRCPSRAAGSCRTCASWAASRRPPLSRARGAPVASAPSGQPRRLAPQRTARRRGWRRRPWSRPPRRAATAAERTSRPRAAGGNHRPPFRAWRLSKPQRDGRGQEGPRAPSLQYCFVISDVHTL